MIAPTPGQTDIRDTAELDLLIVAPAGCGKTEALALRVAGLVERGQVPWPKKLLVTTFSNRARDNVKERLRSHVSPLALRDRVDVANFHGLSARIFKAN
ncbi:MAG TPA: UvrD-helicase domain-containing protein, partial [Acidothermaceae bacterium]|nr:UvrD-helicase domain-containing protein [Acidothermaceae bacterium]